MPSFSRRRGRCVTTASGVPIVPPDALATGSTLAPQAFAYADPAPLGLPEVEVVAICAPPHRHVALVLAAVVAGKHIVCDKPLVVSHNPVPAVRDPSRQRGRAVQIVPQGDRLTLTFHLTP